MKFQQAKRFRMRFGKHKGKTLDDIATTDAGLLYLDYMRGLKSLADSMTKMAINTYLNDPPIARELERIQDT